MNNNKIINIVNFVRACNPRKRTSDLVTPVAEEIKLNKKYNFPNTFLLQYDALIMNEYQHLFASEKDDNMEIGIWFECVQPLVESCGIEWRGREGWEWDWHVNPGFLMAYTNDEKKLMIDEFMRKFQDVFGFYPASVGAWLLDIWSVNYMKERYGIKAVAICREQYGVDAYTLWGGYYNQGYYPSRNNILCPGQTEQNTVKVPVFRMLGVDPIYCYDEKEFETGIDIGCATMEPSWEYGGSSVIMQSYIDSYFKEECMDFAYTTLGQENTFGWDRIEPGLTMQFELVDKLQKNGDVVVAKLCDTGKWFASRFNSNPTVSLVSHNDWANNGIKSVWFNCPYYRANLILDKNKLYFRDINKFDELYRERYTDEPCKEWNAIYDNLPVVDGRIWNGNGIKCGLKFDADVKNLTVKKKDNIMICTAECDGGDEIVITFLNECIKVSKPIQTHVFFERSNEADTKIDVCENKVRYEHNGFLYDVEFSVGLKPTVSGYEVCDADTFDICFRQEY